MTNYQVDAPSSPSKSEPTTANGSTSNLGAHITKDYQLHQPEKSSLPIWLNQLLVMLKRNFTLLLRYRRSTIAQSVIAPMIFTLLLLLLQSIYVARQKTEILHPPTYPLSGIVECQGDTLSSPCITMFYTPYNDLNRLVMQTFSAKNKNRNGVDLPVSSSVVTDTTPPTSKMGIVPIASESLIYDYTLANPNTTVFAVAFQSGLPNARYQLWYNTTSATNGTDIYSGQILSMQRGLDEAILTVASDNNAVQNPSAFQGPIGTLDANRIDIQLKDWPTVAPEYVPDTLVSNYGPLFFFCSVMIIFISVIQDIVSEKELMLRHAMATMGLRASVFWFSNFLTRGILVLIASLVTVIMGIICGFVLFTKTDFFVLLFTFFLFGMAMVCLGFFISTMCTRARVAVLIGIFLFIIGLLFMSFIFSSATIGYIWFDSNTSPVFYTVFSLLPWFHFGKLYLDISTLTNGRYDLLTDTSVPGPGFPFSALYEGISTDLLPSYSGRKPNVPYPATTLHLLMFNIVLYTLLTWYFDKVIPDEYGRRMPPWFFLIPRYWGVGINAESNLQDFISNNLPLGDKNEFRVLNEDDDVAEERKRVFDREIKSAIRIGNLRKVYRNSFFGKSEFDKVAVRSLCLALEEGQLLALLGQNGAGKSTTMSCLSGLTPPTAGDAVIYGSSITKDMEKIRYNLGICPQHDILFPDLTPIEHIELFGGIKHLAKHEIERICKERLGAVRLWKVKDQRAGTFSGGMKRRLSVVISTVGDPRVIFLDEPTTGMDPVNRRHVWAFIEAFKKGRVCVLTTHSMEEADALGDRVAVMARGRLRALGTGVRLKNKFGMGYRIGLTAKLGCTEQAKKLVTDIVTEVELEDDSAGAIIFRLPQSSVAKVPIVIKVLESEEGKHIIESFGISQTSLEDVFLKLIREAMTET